MRLTEIWDPSMYRSGDEYDPRSPDYEGVEVDPDYEQYNTQFTWYLYDEADNETEIVIAGIVEIVTEYGDYFPSRSRGRYYDDDDGPEGAAGVSKITIRQVKVGETVMSGQQAVKQFGNKAFEDAKAEMAESAVDGIPKNELPPKIENWKIETEIAYA